MNIYVNGFSVATNQDEEEVVLHFVQKAPSFGEDGKMGELMVETASDLIMNVGTVKKLIRVLQKLLDEVE